MPTKTPFPCFLSSWKTLYYHEIFLLIFLKLCTEDDHRLLGLAEGGTGPCQTWPCVAAAAGGELHVWMNGLSKGWIGAYVKLKRNLLAP